MRETVERVIAALQMKAYRAFLLDRDAIKTVDYYIRALRRAVLNFYRDEMDAFEFIDEMVRLINEQFTRAWNEGARSVNIDPSEMDDEDLVILRTRILQEQEHVLGFASDIEKARANGDPVAQFYNRVDLWANRYNEVVNLAATHFGKKVKLEWLLGKTELHCTTCARLNGMVAYAYEWEAAGLRPQGAPNPRLECGGWHCDCRLSPTTRRRSRNALATLMSIR